MSNYEEPSTSVQIPKRDTAMMELLQSLMSQMDRMEATVPSPSLTPTMQPLGVVVRH